MADELELVTAQEAFESLAWTYLHKELGKDFPGCLQMAHDTIFARLMQKHLMAYADACFIDCTEPKYFPVPECIVDDVDFFRQPEFGEVPMSFWVNYFNAGESRSYDPIAGDFRFEFDDEDNNANFRSGEAFGVKFDRRGLPSAAIPSWMDIRYPIEASTITIPPKTTRPDPEMTGAPEEPDPPPHNAKQNLPRLPDATLQAWWDALSDDAQSLGQDELWALCRTAFPRHAISRDRIRALAGPRKRGPKGIRGKPTAK